MRGPFAHPASPRALAAFRATGWPLRRRGVSLLAMLTGSSTSRAGEVLAAFTRLGLTSFGGPIAHVGYFRREFVDRRRWLDDAQFTQLLAISQFLPGPASSQLGFAIGYVRAGVPGALAAFVAFTLPSALLLFAVAAAGSWLATPLGLTIAHGLKLTAVAVVTHGLLRMARSMAPDARRAAIALGAAAAMLLGGPSWWQLVVLAAGALVSIALPPRVDARDTFAIAGSPSAALGRTALVLFPVFLTVALVIPAEHPSLAAVAAAFWRAGSLVFGGGHVVLPLLEESLVRPGWLTVDTFLAGYGAAQAVPGPMFSLAAFLGASIPTGATPAFAAFVATLAIFVPGFLLVLGVLPVWSALRRSPRAQRALLGINAAVVGLLLAALVDPVMTQGLAGVADVAIAAAALALLWNDRRSALWALTACVGGAVVQAMLR